VEAAVGAQGRERRRARERVEDRIEIVERVADLVERGAVLLEEERDALRRVEEVVVGAARLLVGREDRDALRRREALDERGGAGAERVARGGIDEAGQDGETVAIERGVHART